MDPSTFAAAIKTAAQLKRTLDTAALKKKVGKIEAAVDDANKTLAEGTLTNLRAGYLHLATAVASSQDDVRRDELLQARKYFAKIASRDAAVDVTGTSATLSAAQVAALSHLGNFHYFILRNEERLALIEAYSCTEKFPALGVKMFPATLFSWDFQKKLSASSMAADKATTELETAQKEHRRERKYHYAERSLSITAAAGVIVGGVVASAINPMFIGGAAVMARKLLEDGFNTRGAPRRPDGADAALKDLAKVKLLDHIAAEARSRRLALED
jgi:hypothetical protein